MSLEQTHTDQSTGETKTSGGADSPTETNESVESPTETLCPVVEAVDQIGSQWRLTVLHELQSGECRFNELKRRTDANARTLSRVLDDLQEMGLVTRRLEEDAPVATYYGLTAKGTSLCPVFDELRSWGQEWVVD